MEILIKGKIKSLNREEKISKKGTHYYNDTIVVEYTDTTGKQRTIALHPKFDDDHSYDHFNYCLETGDFITKDTYIYFYVDIESIYKNSYWITTATITDIEYEEDKTMVANRNTHPFYGTIHRLYKTPLVGKDGTKFTKLTMVIKQPMDINFWNCTTYEREKCRRGDYIQLDTYLYLHNNENFETVNDLYKYLNNIKKSGQEISGYLSFNSNQYNSNWYSSASLIALDVPKQITYEDLCGIQKK